MSELMLTPAERRQIDAIVARAFAEDLGVEQVDVTAVAVSGYTLDADIVARSAGVICGLPAAAAVFRARGIDSFTNVVSDGDRVSAGTVIARVSGAAGDLLTAERTALNLLQQLSGVASLTRQFVDAVNAVDAAHARPRILDTRKTVPGMRALQRYAVRCGGGANHRFGLFDAAMVKDNHVDLVGITAAVAAIRSQHPHVDIIVEVRDLDELREALAQRATVVLLDNMSDEMMREAVAIAAGRALTEASGGVTIDRVASIAALGVDRISIGALTHSAPALDIALDLHVTSMPLDRHHPKDSSA